MKKIRQWLVQQGLFSPKDLKETRELFSFPVKLNKQKKQRPIWMVRHLERM